MKKRHLENSVKWQIEGYRLKANNLKLFLTFIVATIGFAASILWVCDCSIMLNNNCCFVLIYFSAILILIIAMIYGFYMLNLLNKIFFEYSRVHGNLAFSSKDNGDDDFFNYIEEQYKKIDVLYNDHTRHLRISQILFSVGLFLLIISILILRFSI